MIFSKTVYILIGIFFRIPAEIVKNANTVTIETVNSTDTINSNNSWQDTQQYGNFVCNNNS